ncbi:MAG TPA: hypothetical protein VH227_07285 [Candidatus Udaeobacter sp.]|jgi:hypothetical protein|nr:hypothetical protein [Candidatus Udaeobacter sp.]
MMKTASVRRYLSDLGSGSRLERLAALSLVLIGALSLTTNGQCPPSKSTTNASDSLLLRSFVVPLTVVEEFFPDITSEATSEQNSTAVGNHTNTRSVIYANRDSSKKVTISVDQYESSSEASSAYNQAVEKSRIPGFKPVAVPNVGDEAFAGTVTRGSETHVGLGALAGKLIVGVTLAGYDATPDNITKLGALARKEAVAARTALASGRDH